eukprot:412846-Prorocentrum_lima.AAC.1
MTSSLVGSEMCIRDRQSEVRVRDWAVHINCRGHGVSQGLGCGCEAPYACLLYTSDAADDM